MSINVQKENSMLYFTIYRITDPEVPTFITRKMIYSKRYETRQLLMIFYAFLEALNEQPQSGSIRIDISIEIEEYLDTKRGDN